VEEEEDEDEERRRGEEDARLKSYNPNTEGGEKQFFYFSKSRKL